MLPLLTILVGKVAFKEVMGTAQWIAVLLAVVAVTLQLWAYGSLPWISLVVASSFALYGAIRRKLSQTPCRACLLKPSVWPRSRWAGYG